MIELLRLSDLTNAAHYPQTVLNAIRQSVAILDEAYGLDRTRDGDGGLMLIAETAEEVQSLIQSLPWGDLPEYVEVVDSEFIRALYIVSSERSIELYLRRAYATKQMMEGLQE